MEREVQLRQFCQVRSGDKGDTVDISIFAPTQALYEVLERALTAQAVELFFAGSGARDVKRHEIPGVLALKFVIGQALGGGAASSLRSDNLGKACGANLLHHRVRLDDALLAGVPSLCHPPLP